MRHRVQIEYFVLNCWKAFDPSNDCKRNIASHKEAITWFSNHSIRRDAYYCIQPGSLPCAPSPTTYCAARREVTKDPGISIEECSDVTRHWKVGPATSLHGAVIEWGHNIKWYELTNKFFLRHRNSWWSRRFYWHKGHDKFCNCHPTVGSKTFMMILQIILISSSGHYYTLDLEMCFVIRHLCISLVCLPFRRYQESIPIPLRWMGKQRLPSSLALPLSLFSLRERLKFQSRKPIFNQWKMCRGNIGGRRASRHHAHFKRGPIFLQRNFFNVVKQRIFQIQNSTDVIFSAPWNRFSRLTNDELSRLTKSFFSTQEQHGARSWPVSCSVVGMMISWVKRSLFQCRCSFWNLQEVSSRIAQCLGVCG